MSRVGEELTERGEEEGGKGRKEGLTRGKREREKARGKRDREGSWGLFETNYGYFVRGCEGDRRQAPRGCILRLVNGGMGGQGVVPPTSGRIDPTAV